jgi:tetratricopeptide (TPR) repeat protein/predicted aspartyl protease
MDWENTMQRIALGFAAALLLASPARSADSKCQLQKYAELPVTMVGTRPLIAGTINGSPARFLADSGAFFSMISRNSAEKFGLRTGALPPRIRVSGTGGSAQVGLTKVKAFTLAGFSGGRTIENVEFLVGGGAFSNDTDGLIGQNLLGAGDTEFDLANGVIRVFRSDGCKQTSLAYWAGGMPVAEMKIEERTPLLSQPRGVAQLNGKRIRVMFDSGAWRSILNLDTAERVGITPDDEGVIAAGISHGLGKKTSENSIARFDTLDLGGQVIKNARLRIGDLDTGRSDMLLGADFFLSHRIYIASAQNKIYFTYNGGPVFDLRSNPNEAKPAVPAPGTVVDAGATTPVEAGMDAAAYRRRGAASAGRNDFTAALVDLDRAVELDPTDAENWLQRASARWKSGQPRLAAADFDAVLNLKPDHLDALISRGTLRLRSNDASAAKIDFDRALQLAPTDPSVGFRIAESYQAAGNFVASIEQLDSWIATYPRDGRFSAALNMRCWSRAMTGKDLELARSDCDQALKKGPKNSAVFDSRGLVWLQLGNYDEAIDDYKAALKLQPKKASSLYGLGLAEIKKGLKDSGNSNLQRALEINPAIASFYRRAGLGI